MSQIVKRDGRDCETRSRHYCDQSVPRGQERGGQLRGSSTHAAERQSRDETEEYAAWEAARLKAADAAAIAWTELATIRPTTGAGAIALINCYLEIWSEQPSKVDYREVSGALKTLRAFLRSIAE
jgi:hypothetical protein